ncbi:MAG: hypothetical protein M3179_05880 [Actinomycetota bacterium]|nr:hypothetical protein [Actinomycetota bacterium]
MVLSVLAWVGIGVAAALVGRALTVADWPPLLLIGVLGAVAGALLTRSWAEPALIGAVVGGMAGVVLIGSAREIAGRRMV